MRNIKLKLKELQRVYNHLCRTKPEPLTFKLYGLTIDVKSKSQLIGIRQGIEFALQQIGHTSDLTYGIWDNIPEDVYNELLKEASTLEDD